MALKAKPIDGLRPGLPTGSNVLDSGEKLYSLPLYSPESVQALYMDHISSATT